MRTEYCPRNRAGRLWAFGEEAKARLIVHDDQAGFFFGLTERSVAEDLDSAIKQNAEGPESAEADGVRVKQHTLPDQIAADKYLASKQAVSKNPAKAFTRVKIVPPGTV